MKTSKTMTNSDDLYRKYAEHIADSGRSNIIDEVMYLIKNLDPKEKEELEEVMRTIIA